MDQSMHDVLARIFARASCKCLRVRDVPGPPDERGQPTVLASVTVRSATMLGALKLACTYAPL